MIMRIKPDKQKAKSLMDMAKITLKRLNEINKEKYPSNTLTDYYDIIRRLMESLNSLEGIKIKGEGAHQQIIDYVCDKYSLN
jgi:ribosomal protein L11